MIRAAREVKEEQVDEATRQLGNDLGAHLTPIDGTVKPMFGGYCIYVDDKAVGWVNDGRIFVKIMPATDSLAGWADRAPAYYGAKDSWRLPVSALQDDPDRVVEALQATAAALPAKRPRTR